MLQLVTLCTKSQVSDKCELWYFTLHSYYKTLSHAKCYVHVYGWTESNAATANTALGELCLLLSLSTFQACTKMISSTLPCHTHFSQYKNSLLKHDQD